KPNGSQALRMERRRPSGYGEAAFAHFATRDFPGLPSPSSPFGLRRGSLRYERACLAEAGAACEGWWSQAGSNRRPLACERRALPAELWPRRDRLKMTRSDRQSAPFTVRPKAKSRTVQET